MIYQLSISLFYFRVFTQKSINILKFTHKIYLIYLIIYPPLLISIQIIVKITFIEWILPINFRILR